MTAGAYERLVRRWAAARHDVAVRLQRQEGLDAVCLVRHLSYEERDGIDATLPADTPTGVDALVALDVRFRRPLGGIGVGTLIVPRWFSQSALESAGGVTPRYASELAVARDRRDIANELRDFFIAAYARTDLTPIERMIPVHLFAEFADEVGMDVDEASMRENNSSGFAVREIRDTGRFSRHAVGAVDLNPFRNPMVTVDRARPDGVRPAPADVTEEDLESGVASIVPPTAWRHAFGREHQDRPDLLTAQSATVHWFREHGWSWGGDWTTLKDYQHFSPGSE